VHAGRGRRRARAPRRARPHTFTVDHVWELPTSTWPDGRQCFINLQSRPGALAEPTRIIDLHISELSDRHRFVDVRRHGTPIVVALYLGFALSPLVRLLRVEHCPSVPTAGYQRR
jgi:hypothetical protein